MLCLFTCLTRQIKPLRAQSRARMDALEEVNACSRSTTCESGLDRSRLVAWVGIRVLVDSFDFSQRDMR